jgi:hypothetical protein
MADFFTALFTSGQVGWLPIILIGVVAYFYLTSSSTQTFPADSDVSVPGTTNAGKLVLASPPTTPASGSTLNPAYSFQALVNSSTTTATYTVPAGTTVGQVLSISSTTGTNSISGSTVNVGGSTSVILNEGNSIWLIWTGTAWMSLGRGFR